MVFKEIGYEVVNWILLDQNKCQWRAFYEHSNELRDQRKVLVNKIMTFRVS
jgi:hypothetical protein